MIYYSFKAFFPSTCATLYILTTLLFFCWILLKSKTNTKNKQTWQLSSFSSILFISLCRVMTYFSFLFFVLIALEAVFVFEYEYFSICFELSFVLLVILCVRFLCIYFLCSDLIFSFNFLLV